MKTILKTIFTLFLLASAPSLFANSELAKKYSDAELIEIIKGEGYSAVKKAKEGTIHIKIDGRSYFLLNKKDGDLQTYYSIGGANISYKDINEWNKTKRLSRAYLDKDSDLTLESDLLANAGLSEKMVTEFFSVFKGSVKVFRRFIVEQSNINNASDSK